MAPQMGSGRFLGSISPTRLLRPEHPITPNDRSTWFDAALADRYADHLSLLHELERLPRRQRAVIVLRYYEDLPDNEIAQVLGCTTSTVRGYAMQALRALRVELAAPGATRIGGAERRKP